MIRISNLPILVFVVLSVSLAHADPVDGDIRELNKIFGLQLERKDLGNILAWCVPELDRVYAEEGELQSHRFSVLSALAYFGSNETLTTLIAAFEENERRLGPEQARGDRQSFYDGIVQGLLARGNWQTIIGLLRQNRENLTISHFLLRRLWFRLIANDNLDALERIHNTSTERDPFDKNFNASALAILQAQPWLAAKFDMDLFKYVAKDIVENLLKYRDDEVKHAQARVILKRLITFYSNNQSLPMTGQSVQRSKYKRMEVRSLLKAMQGDFRGAEAAFQELSSIWSEITESPVAEKTEQHKRTREVVEGARAGPVTDFIEDRVILARDATNKVTHMRLNLVEQRRAEGRALPVPIPAAPLLALPPPPSVAPGPGPAESPGSVKKAKTESKIQTCSDLALLIMRDEVRDDLIMRAIKTCSNARVCTVNKEQVPTALLMVQKGRLELVREFQAYNSEMCGLDSVCDGPRTLREVIVDYLLAGGKIGDAGRFLQPACFPGAPEVKLHLLLKLITAHLGNQLSLENFETLLAMPGVFEAPVTLYQTREGGQLLESLVSNLVEKGQSATLVSVLSLPWFIDAKNVKAFAREHYLKALNAQKYEEALIWIESKLFNFNEEEIPFPK